MKILGNCLFKAPQVKKWVFLAEGLFLGRVGKMKKNKYFQNYWTRQKKENLSFKIFVP